LNFLTASVSSISAADDVWDALLQTLPQDAVATTAANNREALGTELDKVLISTWAQQFQTSAFTHLQSALAADGFRCSSSSWTLGGQNGVARHGASVLTEDQSFEVGLELVLTSNSLNGASFDCQLMLWMQTATTHQFLVVQSLVLVTLPWNRLPLDLLQLAVEVGFSAAMGESQKTFMTKQCQTFVQALSAVLAH
jgi:hypothetical protein